MTRFSKGPLKTAVFLPCLLAALLACQVPLSAQEDLMDFDHTLRFARYLHSSNQFAFAAQEYERLHYHYPAHSTVLYELVRNYRYGENCEQLDRSYDLFSRYGQLGQPLYTKEYLNFCLTCRALRPEFQPLAGGLDESSEAFYMLSYYWKTGRYDSAFSYNRQHQLLLEKEYEPLYALTVRFEEQSYKSPALALMMSAVLPGSGRAYSGRWRDAVISFVMIGTTAFTSYRAFSKKGIRSFNGWFLGGISFSFYISNLYGSFRAAQSYNLQTVNRYQDEAGDILRRYY